MNNSRLQFLLRKSAGKRYMAEYLTELSRLITNNKFRILNFEESDIMSKSIMDNHEKLLFKMDYWECRNILFTQKEKLKGVITKIQLAYSAPVYMSIGYSDMCGLVVIERISLFNSDFEFNDEHSGLIVLYDKSASNKLVIDFYEEGCTCFYDLQLFGEQWAKCRE